PAPTGAYPLSLPAALPIYQRPPVRERPQQLGRDHAGRLLVRLADSDRPAQLRDLLQHVRVTGAAKQDLGPAAGPDRRRSVLAPPDRKSTRLNSSHSQISYA